MSIYDNETASKISPDLNRAAPQEPQTHHFKKLTKIEAYLLDKIEVRERISKRFNAMTGIVNTGLITSTVVTEGITIAAFVSDVGLPVAIALSRTSLLPSLATVITQKSFKTFTEK